MSTTTTDTARANSGTIPMRAAPGRALSLVGHPTTLTQDLGADEGTTLPEGQPAFDAQKLPALGGTTPPAATIAYALPNYQASRLADPSLALSAEIVDDLERVRIANANRLRILTATDADSDGEHRGFGLSLDHPDVARLAGIVDAMTKLEHDATLGLQRHMRAHPLGPWVAATIGIGEKQAARLIAATGDPYWNALHGRPRTVSELWAYSGLHTLPADQASHDTQLALIGGAHTGSDPGQSDPGTPCSDARVAAKRRKGQRSNWSNTTKMRAHLCATSCIKQARSPYRAIYDTRRTHTTTTHPEWTPGHSHNDALRIVSKAILRDLWRAARDIHEPFPPN